MNNFSAPPMNGQPAGNVVQPQAFQQPAQTAQAQGGTPQAPQQQGFTLDQQAAKKAGAGGYINTTGAYVGEITKAKLFTAGTGTLGVEFEFKSDDGETANSKIYYQKANGEAITGQYNLINAMMMVGGIQSAPAQQTQITERNRQTGREDVVQAWVMPAFYNKKMGLVFQIEEYEKKENGFPTGEIGRSPKIYAAFKADTKQMPAEMLNQAPAQRLEQILATLKDKTVQVSTPPQAAPMQQPAPSHGQAPAQQGQQQPFNDDIPF